MKMTKKIIPFSAILCICIVAWALAKLSPDVKAEMIVNYGLRTANSILATALVVAIICAVCIVFFIIKHIIDTRPEPAQSPEPDVQISVENIKSPSVISRDFERLYETRPRLRNELERSIEQLGSIQRKDKSLNELIRRSGKVGILPKISEEMDRATETVCIYLSLIVQRANVWDPNEAGLNDKAELYNQRRTEITEHIASIDKILDGCDLLLNQAQSVAEGHEEKEAQNGMNSLDALNEALDMWKRAQGKVK